jgi:hypothetical protein
MTRKVIEKPAGERIVAFARPGKPREGQFTHRAFRQGCLGEIVLANGYLGEGILRTPAPSLLQQFATVFKAHSDRKAGRIISSRKRQIVPAAKKRDVRRSVQQTGWITLEGGFAVRECLVHDMSSTGAKLSVSDGSLLSGGLRLAFSRDAKTGRQCQVVWRRGRSFGVKFVR